MTNYIPPKHLTAHQQALCVALDSFIRLCDDHRIKYFACGGTAIGAVRHNGFIPWDDDIDVYMLREDYDRFLALKEKLTDTEYEIIDPSNTSYYLPFAKYSHKHSTLWEYEENTFILGVYIDIFPLDYCDGYTPTLISEGNKVKQVWDNYKRGLRTLTKERMKRMLQGNWIELKGFITEMIYYRLKKDSFRRQFNQLINQLKLISRQDGQYCYCYGPEVVSEHEVFQRSWFADTVAMPFENLMINMPIGYHEYMTSQYGNYMQLPPIEHQISHHPFYYINLERRLCIKDIQKELKGSL